MMLLHVHIRRPTLSPIFPFARFHVITIYGHRHVVIVIDHGNYRYMHPVLLDNFITWKVNIVLQCPSVRLLGSDSLFNIDRISTVRIAPETLLPRCHNIVRAMISGEE